MMHTLHVKPVRGRPFTQKLQSDSIVVGRSRNCDLVLNDEAISRRHARIFLEDGLWHVEDLNSRNGTLVDEIPVYSPVLLEDHNLINLSGNTLYITAEQPTSSGSASSLLCGGTLIRSASDILDANHAPITTTDEKSLRMVAARLSVLNEVHDALSKPITSDALLELILERIFKHLKPEEAVIFLRTRDDRLELAGRKSIPGLEESSLYSQTLVSEVAEGGKAAIVADLATDDRFSSSDSMVNAGIRSLVAAPLMDNDGNLGMIVLASRIAVRSFSEEDMALLVSLASLAALRIRNIMLMEEAANALRDANAMLERKVAERTAALEKNNLELQEKNNAILRRQNQLILQEKMASVGTMAAGVAHLIKNPLNFVKNLSEVSAEMVDELFTLLGRETQMEEAGKQAFRETLEDIKTNATIVHTHGVRADNIVVSLMEYAREPAKADRRLTDINALVEKYAQLALHGALAQSEREIKMVHHHDHDVGLVTVFAGELSRTFIGMINNAVDAVDEKRRKVGDTYVGLIETFTKRAAETVEITIQDNGIGIPKDAWKQLFTPFYTTKHNDAHIGLGLSIGYETVTHRHQGTLTVDSQPDEFTRFTISLPIGEPPSTLP